MTRVVLAQAIRYCDVGLGLVFTEEIMETTTRGWWNGFFGVLIFAGSLPATRVAVLDLDPVFLTMARASIAGCLGWLMLLLMRQPRPGRDMLPALLLVALGVVLGFPLLTALAMQHMTSAEGLVYLGLLPLCTAIFGVIRTGDRPRPLFWLFALLGSGFVAAYALHQVDAVSWKGGTLMLAACIVCGLGYAEGARLTRVLGGWQVISWALVLSLPVMLPLAWWWTPTSFVSVSTPAWIGLAYVSLFSMLIGFVFWYRGLALGGVAAVGQLQLIQPFFGLALAAALLNESVSWTMLIVTLATVVCVAGAKRFAG